MKLKEWLPKWLEIYVYPTSKMRTYTRYSEIVFQHIIPNLGEFELSDLTVYEIQCFITELLKTGNLKTGRGLAVNSVNSIITIIQNSLKSAKYSGVIDEYIGDKIKRPKPQEKRVECLTVEEQIKLEKYIIDSNKAEKYIGIILCLYTGLRIGELLALEWSDVDFKKYELSVTKSCYYGKNETGVYQRMVSEPKTATSVRIIPIPKQIIPLMRDCKKNSHSELIVSNGEKNITLRTYQRRFSVLLKKLNIQSRGFHSLRHTFATRAIECGIDVKALSEILGHKNPTVTLNRYAHSLMEHKKEMINRLGKIGYLK